MEQVGNFQLLIFVVGTAVGSFLNVVIDRLPARYASASVAGGPKGESIWRGRSHCDYCNHQLRWYELIPLLSFTIQRGRCRECGGKLSYQYPAIEFFTGALTVLTITSIFSNWIPTIVCNSPAAAMLLHTPNPDCLTWQALFTLLFQLVTTYALLAIAVIDLKEGIIPDKLTLLLVVTALLYLVWVAGSRPRVLYTHLGAGLGAAGSLWLLAEGATRLLGKPAMGLGDVKFAFAMGLILGWPNIVIGMYLASVLGAVFALILIAIGKKRFGQTIPFGPFLAAATWLVMLWSGALVSFWQAWL